MRPLGRTVTLSYLGNGPSATGSSGGWSLGKDHLVRCIKCGDFITIPEDGPSGTKDCGCGSLYFDGGRFGSRFGDGAIEVYQKHYYYGLQPLIRREEPRLQAVFGPLAAVDDAEVRQVFRQVDNELIELGRHFGILESGLREVGLKLDMFPLGQAMIAGYVGSCFQGDGSKCVEFSVTLSPEWWCGDPTGETAWNIEADVSADCQHSTDHGGLELVYKLPARRAESPHEAALALLEITDTLVRLGKKYPLETWLQMASDDPPKGLTL